MDLMTVKVLDDNMEDGEFLRKNQYFFYHFFLRWIRHLFDADALHLKVHEEKLDRPLIIIANHLSGWDPFLIVSVLNRKFILRQIVWRIPSEIDQFKSWYRRLFFKLVGIYPIEKKGEFSKSLKSTFDIIDKGQNLIFFPEAKKISLQEKAEPKKGISYILENRKVYVLPVFLEYKRRHKNKKGVKIGKARVVIGNIMKSEYFVEKYPFETRHNAIMSYVYDLERHLIKRFNKR